MESSTDRGVIGAGASSDMADEIAQLQHGFTQLRSDMVNLFTHAFGLGRTSATAARDSAADVVDNFKHKLSDKLTDWKARGADSFAVVEKKVGENPFCSAMIAFGVGFLVAKVLRHRRG